MATTVVMPQLGNTVESCLLTTWLVTEGDTVDENTTLCEIETDKSAMDVPAGVSGTVLKLLAEEGDDVPVKQAIAIIGAPGEDISAALAAAGASDEPAIEATPETASEAAPAAPAPASTAPEAVRTDGPVTAASPRARSLAERSGLPLDAVTSASGPHGRVIERDVAATLAAGPRPTAGAKGADLAGLEYGTGLGGRVTRADLAAAPAAAPAPAAASREYPGEFTDTPLKGIRKIVAERMMNALATSAQLTYDISAPAAGMLALRKRFKNSDAELGFNGITLGDLVCYATVKTLARHDNLNAHLDGGVLRTFRSVHLGLAVDTPRGLLVPTIRNADAMSLRELSNTTKELANAARDGKIDPDLLTGATFTVSNLGSFGVESFTPIINVPQTGILGVNTITPRATINADGVVVVEQRIGFSLTADHQVVDGADAGRFLADLVKAITNIDLTVLG